MHTFVSVFSPCSLCCCWVLLLVVVVVCGFCGLWVMCVTSLSQKKGLGTRTNEPNERMGFTSYQQVYFAIFESGGGGACALNFYHHLPTYTLQGFFVTRRDRKLEPGARESILNFLLPLCGVGERSMVSMYIPPPPPPPPPRKNLSPLGLQRGQGRDRGFVHRFGNAIARRAWYFAS